MADETDLELNELETKAAATDGVEALAAPEPELNIPDLPEGPQDLEAVYDIPVQVSAVLGKATMQVNQLLKLGRGAVVELDRKVGEAIDIYVKLTGHYWFPWKVYYQNVLIILVKMKVYSH